MLYPQDATVTSVAVRGRLIDWRSSSAIAGARIDAYGVSPPLFTFSDANGDFTLDPVPAQGALILIVTPGDGHVTTISSTIWIGSESIEALFVPVLSSVDALTFGQNFAVQQTSGGAILGLVLDSAQNPLSGISDLRILPDTMSHSSAFYLSQSRQPAPSASATSSAGGFVFLNVTTSNLVVQVADPAGDVFSTVGTIVRPGAWTLVDLAAEPPPPPGEETPTPTETPGGDDDDDDGSTEPVVDFVTQVYPIFGPMDRNCASCHKGGQPGDQVGKLKLNENAGKVCTELTVEVSPRSLVIRVDKIDPPASLILTKPLGTGHPNIQFVSTEDPDYRMILRWIEQGAVCVPG